MRTKIDTNFKITQIMPDTVMTASGIILIKTYDVLSSLSFAAA